MSSVARFLRGVKANLACIRPANAIIVTGNEATDLDSTVSAIALCHVLQMYGGCHLIPMVNTDHRPVLRMRGEVMHVLDQMGVNLDDLLYLDEVCEWSKEGGAKVWLLDHNEPSLRWELRYPQIAHRWPICAIIDHHQDAGLFPAVTPRIVQTAGSTCSLLFKWLQEQPLDAASRIRFEEVKPSLLDTIVFDTMGLTWRDTPLDHAILSSANTFTNRFAELQATLIDERQFAVKELLSKDFKLYRDAGVWYGISTVHLDFGLMLEKEGGIEGFLRCVKDFMTTEGLSLYLMVNAVYDPNCSNGYYQQLAIFEDMGVIGCLEAGGAQLELIDRGTNYALFNQLNVDISRKHVHPMVRKYLLRK